MKSKSKVASNGSYGLSPQESYDLLEIVEARCQRSIIFCTQYQSEGRYARIDPNPDSGSPVSEAIMDRIIHNAYKVLVEGRVSMRERNGLKFSSSKGGKEDAWLPLPSLGFPM